MAKVNKTRYALLGVLNLMSGSGYDIKKFCDSSIGHFWNENYGHIYPVLKKMEEEFLITKKVKKTEGRPSKNIYSITEKGKEELEKWITRPVEQQPIRSELLLKIFLSKDISVKNVIEKIQKLKKDSEENLKKYLKVENLLKEKNNMDKKNLILWLSTINFGKHDDEAKIKWCEETLKALEEIKDL
ncbi:PadR family transcriptional regulator [Clostridium taeniosporum]|uniref:PadR family transcriptional regulator n=1 Tax=Clostridium taeniosporum TaxID=394958 RepID=A0A1D7XJL4_9CLOT|nr:PadR family transcriptional regulator [Clostridium taeniosporum]AOR23380.1 PadR family transcriptional regulator [Clostridium taeniosporum]